MEIGVSLHNKLTSFYSTLTTEFRDQPLGPLGPTVYCRNHLFRHSLQSTTAWFPLICESNLPCDLKLPTHLTETIYTVYQVSC